ncbi:MAG: type II secretion system protein [Chitinispirillaceae bacterium]|nr:type II secretion system protein [Chitinispirillaceae bacterium]
MIAKNRGFTLVEILVAAVVISLSLFATIAMVRKAQELTSLDRHRRAARAIIERTLETPTYTRDAYYGLAAGTQNQNVLIDKRNNLQGTLTVTVGNEQNINGAMGIAIPHKRITMTVTWQERSAANTTTTESVNIEKWVSP